MQPLVLITGGHLGYIYGRKRIFMTGVVGFTTFSLICGLAPTTGVLIAARFGQGAFGVLMVPQVLAWPSPPYVPALERKGLVGVSVGRVRYR